MIKRLPILWAATALGALALSACGGGSDDTTVGGTVSGLPAGATVQVSDNNATPLSVSANGVFEFATLMAPDTTYDVTVTTQPVGASCAVSNGVGAVDGGGDAVTSIAVTCIPGTTISGTLAGLAANESLTLSDGVSTLTVAANGAIQFPDFFLPGTTYAVVVATLPAGQVCTVTNGSGTVDGNGDAVTNVAVTCGAASSVGGSVTGLNAGATVTLSDGLSTDSVTANGAFAFGDSFAPGAAYAVTVITQPSGQVCTVTGGSGTIDSVSDAVTSVAVACESDGSVSGSVSGLAANNAVSLTDGVTTVALTGNGAFAFPEAFAAGAAYAVTVSSQPGTQTCTITNASGMFDTSDDPVFVTVACN